MGQLGHTLHTKSRWFEPVPRQIKFAVPLHQDKVVQVCAARTSSVMLLNDGKLLWFGSNQKIKNQLSPTELHLAQIVRI